MKRMRARPIRLENHAAAMFEGRRIAHIPVDELDLDAATGVGPEGRYETSGRAMPSEAGAYALRGLVSA